MPNYADRPDTRNEVFLLSAKCNNLYDIDKFRSYENNVTDNKDACPAILNTIYIDIVVNKQLFSFISSIMQKP